MWNSSIAAALGVSHGDSLAGSQNHLIKILCPNTAIGSIIGRGGSVINQLNQSTGARIKLSQNQDFFPMTDDRVIGISGSLECIAVAIGELITKIIEVSVNSIIE
jgi:RNA-binding protein Nova